MKSGGFAPFFYSFPGMTDAPLSVLPGPETREAGDSSGTCLGEAT